MYLDKYYILSRHSGNSREIKNSKSSSHYYDLRKAYNNLLRKYNLDTIKLELRDLLVRKFQSLVGDRDCGS